MFPLPLNAFEEYLLRDERPSHPLAVAARLTFSRPFRREALEAAVASLGERHPLLGCRIRERGGEPRWVPEPGWTVPVTWNPERNAHGFPDQACVDPRREPPTRIWVGETAAGHELACRSHHAALDGIGLVQALWDLLVTYAAHLDGTDAPSLRRLDPRRLEARGRPLPPPPGSSRRRSFGVRGTAEFLVRSPALLVPSRRTPGSARPAAGFPWPHSAELTREETRALDGAAGARGVSVNDLLLRDLLVAVDGWRRDRPDYRPRDWIRVAVPVNLRRRADLLMPAANHIGMVFFDRRGVDTRRPAELLEGLGAQMREILRRRLQNTLPLLLEAGRRIPGFLPLVTRSDSVLSSLTLSNLGEVPVPRALPSRDGRAVIGGSELLAMDGLVPLRPNLQASLLTLVYAGRRRVVLHADPRALDHADASDLLGRYLDALRRSGRS